VAGAGGAADGKDNDCDGMTDEDCLPDRDGDTYSPPQDCDDNDPEVHPGAAEACNGRDDDCDRLVDEGVQNACGGCGAVGDEVCGDGLDNDCDGEVDEGCGGCLGSEALPCYRGPPGTEGKGICRMGEMQCDGEYWGPCQGDVLPEPESCNQLDDDCDGETDERWAIGSNACGYCQVDEACDGEDNDCDGLTDEGLRNACGDCLPVPEETVCNDLDDDCDGLTDEGLLNACGTCGDSCFDQSWGGPGHGDQWSQGTADGVSNNTDPDSLMLDSTTLSPHFIWIAGTTTLCTTANGCLSNPGCYPGEDCHVVRKFDTRTNELMGIYSSWGWSPSRTAVAVDNTVWVGNRGCHDNLSNCDSDNPMHGNAVHLDADGNLICRADVTCGTDGVAVRAVTIDKAGHAWLGCWQDGHIYQYSGSEVDTAQNPPRCVRLRDVNLGGSRAYGAAVDGNGFLWIATLNNGALKKINTATGEIVMSVSPGVQTYGVAVDQNNNVWLGNWSGGATGVVRVNGETGEYTLVPRSQGTLTGQSRGVAVDQQGNIWVAEWSNRSVSKYAPDGTHLGQYALGTGANGPLGMAVDFDNNIWAIAYSSGHASKFDFDGNHLATFSVGSAPYTYSDMTGYQLRTVTLKHGTWTVDFDSGYDNAQWDSVTWGGSLAADDQIRIRARSAATEGALAGAVWSPYHDTDFNQPSPWTASLQGEIPRGRWVQIEVTLTTQDDVSPVFSSLVVHWQY
jgi:streptogramin lyase